MDDVLCSCQNIKNKRLSQLIQKKYKNRHKKKKKYKYRRKRLLSGKSKNKKNNTSSLKKSCSEFQYQSSNIFTIDEITQSGNRRASTIQHDHDYYSLEELIVHCANKKETRRKRAKPGTPANNPVYKLYDDAYMHMTSVSACNWIKLQNVGKFFKSSIYAFHHSVTTTQEMELERREREQNTRVITCFLQNVVQEIYDHVLSDDLAHVIGGYLRGYLEAKCKGRSCSKTYMKFFYEDRYLGVNAYFALSHKFEENDLIYCAACTAKTNICKCDCGEMDFEDEFTMCLCYEYSLYDVTMQIDEFRCHCNTHQLRCSRHPICEQCKRTVCHECELYGWLIDKDTGLCTKCASGHDAVAKCAGCTHIFEEEKMSKCMLCDSRLCNNVKWRQYPLESADKAALRETYDEYLNQYKCKCVWKSKYFDGNHNLWYPMYSEWQRRIELKTQYKKCDLHETLKCVYCRKNSRICYSCDIALSPNKSDIDQQKRIICNDCTLQHRHKCNVCDTHYVNYNGNAEEIVYHDQTLNAALNNMHTLCCIDCERACYICDQCEMQTSKFYQCNECKQTNRRHFCAYCECLYYDHDLGDKVYTNEPLPFAYFVKDIYCKQCHYFIQNMCSHCYEEKMNDLACLDCLRGICMKCHTKIEHGTGQTLCQFCNETERESRKTENQFISSKIDKKSKNKKRNKRCWKYKTEMQRKASKRGKMKDPSKRGKFVYRVNYGRDQDDWMDVEIRSTWKKYRSLKS